MIFNPDSEISNSEILYRAVLPFTVHWDFELNKPSSGLFKSDVGLSVDRDGERDEEEIVLFLESNYKEDCGFVKASAKECRECDTEPIPKPINPDNIFHAEINGRSRQGTTKSQAKKLKDAFKLVKFPIFHKS